MASFVDISFSGIVENVEGSPGLDYSISVGDICRGCFHFDAATWSPGVWTGNGILNFLIGSYDVFSQTSLPWNITISSTATDFTCSGWSGTAGISLVLNLADSSGTAMLRMLSPSDLSRILSFGWHSASFNIITDPAQPLLAVTGRLNRPLQAPTNLTIK